MQNQEDIKKFNIQYIKSTPEQRKAMSSELLQDTFESILSTPYKQTEIDSDVLKFIAHKSFNNSKNQDFIKSHWTMNFIFEQIILRKKNKQVLINLLDILSNITGRTTNKCEFNYTTAKGTGVQVLPLKLREHSDGVAQDVTPEQIQTLITLLSNEDILISRYAARCLLNFSYSNHLELSEKKLHDLSLMIQNKEELTRMYIYGALHNLYIDNKKIMPPDLQAQLQSFQSKISTISRTDFENTLNNYKTNSLWRWFWSLLGLMSKESGTIFCLRQLLTQNNAKQLSLDEIGRAINDKENYDSQKNNRFRLFQAGTIPTSTDFATEQVISKIRSIIQ